MADAASRDWDLLAAESGRLYQTLPPSIAPIQGTTSPRNLWAAILYGRLRDTSWLVEADVFEYVGLPFAASAELWRQMLHGKAVASRIEDSRALSEGAQRILLATAAAKRQTVTMNSDMYGFHLGTGDGAIIDSNDDRQIAVCRAWVEELLDEELIEDRWQKGTGVSRDGKGIFRGRRHSRVDLATLQVAGLVSATDNRYGVGIHNRRVTHMEPVECQTLRAWN